MEFDTQPQETETSTAPQFDGLDDENLAEAEAEASTDTDDVFENGEGPDDANADDGEADADDQGDDETGYFEFEVDGEAFKLPEKLKAAVMKASDYTQKTQALAEKVREVEQAKKYVEQVAQLSDFEINTKVQLDRISAELKQYEKVNWDQFEQEDPAGAGSAWRKYQMLQNEANQHSQAYQQAQQHRSQIQSQELRERWTLTRQFAEKNIPGWSLEFDDKVTAYASQFFPKEQLAQAITPQIYQVLCDAYLGHQTRQRATAKPKAAVAGQIKPLVKVASKGSGKSTRDPSSMSMEEYARQRQSNFKG